MAQYFKNGDLFLEAEDLDNLDEFEIVFKLHPEKVEISKNALNRIMNEIDITDRVIKLIKLLESSNIFVREALEKRRRLDWSRYMPGVAGPLLPPVPYNRSEEEKKLDREDPFYIGVLEFARNEINKEIKKEEKK